MKKILLAIVLVACGLAASAQTKMFRWGVEAGMNFNSLSFDKEMFESSNRAGFFVGPKVKLNIPLLGFGADAALTYSMNGVNVENPNTGTNISKNLSNIEIPLNIRYDFSLFKVLAIYLATGPQYNYCLSSDATIAELYGKADGTISRSTWGWNIGGGFELFDHLQLGVTYTIPISDSGSLTWADATNIISNYKQKTVKVRLAYYF
ncbi:MAG: porin family protein [Bacteroidaceae bacterium]|nr:porin family protein [Bacteroidaceae bacterium]